MEELSVVELNVLACFMKHERTSCEAPNVGISNAFFNEYGFPRCNKCAILHRVRHGEWPHGARVVEWNLTPNIQFEKEK